ncbi:MAG: hypothetical protein BJ554DRAFT_2215, partial [Olpidium bornovanus]
TRFPLLETVVGLVLGGKKKNTLAANGLAVQEEELNGSLFSCSVLGVCAGRASPPPTRVVRPHGRFDRNTGRAVTAVAAARYQTDSLAGPMGGRLCRGSYLGQIPPSLFPPPLPPPFPVSLPPAPWVRPLPGPGVDSASAYRSLGCSRAPA